MVVDRETFDQVLGRRNPGVMSVFDCLDSDADGQVDTFEVLLTLTLWCCAPWEEKVSLLFRCFDFNQKGSLRFPELALMAVTAARVHGRFSDFPDSDRGFGALKEPVSAAFGGGQTGELKQDGFAKWFGSSKVTQQLRDFVDEHLSSESPEAVEVLVRERVRMLEYRGAELAGEASKLQEAAEKLKEETGTRCPDAWERVDGLFGRLSTAVEAQRAEIAELTASLTEAAAQGGPVALLEPRARLAHSGLIKDICAMHQQCREYMSEIKGVLGQILEQTQDLESRASTPLMATLPTLPKAASADPAEAARLQRAADRELRRRGARRPVGPLDPLPAEATPSTVREHSRMVNVPVWHERNNSEAPASPQAPSAAADDDPAAPADAAVAEVAGSADEVSLPQGASGILGDDGESTVLPVVVAFAEFVPPEGSDTQMLKLMPGDEIMAMGQDGQGWWYGRMSDGSEGWFPPSYVQLKSELEASQAAGAAA